MFQVLHLLRGFLNAVFGVYFLRRRLRYIHQVTKKSLSPQNAFSLQYFFHLILKYLTVILRTRVAYELIADEVRSKKLLPKKLPLPSAVIFY